MKALSSLRIRTTSIDREQNKARDLRLDYIGIALDQSTAFAYLSACKI